MILSAAGCLLSVARTIAGRGPQQPTGNRQPPTGKMYQPEKVRLFIKPFCGWCAQAMDWLDARGIPHEVLDVVANDKAYEEMCRLSGQTLAPVIDVDGEILADFGAKELAKFWKKLERKSW